MNKRPLDGWMKTKRTMAVLVAISLWVASAVFSYNGFSLNDPSSAWLGAILTISITVIELIFNADISRLNLTLFVSGLLAYTYGVATNIMGFYAAQGGNMEKVYAHPESVIFAVLVGAMLEIIPEPMFIWGIGVYEGDFLANIIKGKKKIDNQDWIRTQQYRPNTAPGAQKPPDAGYRPITRPVNPIHVDHDIVRPRSSEGATYRPVLNNRNKAGRK